MPEVFVAGLVVAGRPCVVFGGDAEAEDKALRLAVAQGEVTVVSEAVSDALAQAALDGRIAWHRRSPALDDADGAFLVVSTLRDENWSAALLARATARGGFLLCCIDQPAYCTFTQLATVRRGALQIAVATAGEAPMLAARIRAAMDTALGSDLADLVQQLGALRAATPPADRRARIAKALEGFAWEIRYRLPRP